MSQSKGVQENYISNQSAIVQFQSDANPLEEAIDVLGRGSALAKKVAPPINSITNALQKVIKVVDDVETVIEDLNKTGSTANVLADIGFSLTEIPVVGEVTDLLSSGLRDFAGVVNEIAVPLNKFKAEVLDEVKSVVGKICSVCNKIDSYITYFATK